MFYHKISAKQKNSLQVLTGQQVSASVGKLFAHFAEDLEKLTEAGMVKMLLLVKLMARLHPKRWNGSVTKSSQILGDSVYSSCFLKSGSLITMYWCIVCMDSWMSTFSSFMATLNPGNLAIEAAPMEQVLPRQFVGTQRWFWCYQKRFDLRQCHGNQYRWL